MTSSAVARCTTRGCRNYTAEGTCVPCRNGNDPEKEVYYLDRDQDGDRDQDRATFPSATHGMGLGLGSKGQLSELEELRAAYRAGMLEPAPVELGPIPAHFGSAQRAIADDMQ